MVGLQTILITSCFVSVAVSISEDTLQASPFEKLAKINFGLDRDTVQYYKHEENTYHVLFHHPAE